MSQHTKENNSRVRINREWIAPALVVIYQILAATIFVIISVSAINWIRAPFIGAFIEHSLLISKIHPPQSDHWPLSSTIDNDGYQVVAINEHTISSIYDLNNTLHNIPSDTVINVTVKSVNGSKEHKTIQLSSFSRTDQITYFLIPFSIGIIYFGSSIWVFSLRGKDAVGRAYAVFATSIALVAAGLFDIYTSNRTTYVWTISLGMAGGSLISLAMLYPQEHPIVNRFPFLRWIGYLIGLLAALYAIPTIYNQVNPLAYITAWQIEYIIGAIAILIFIGLSVSRYYKTSYPVIREQSRLILIGIAISICPVIIWLFVMKIFPQLHFSTYVLIPIVFFAIVMVYAISSYRLLSTNYLFSRSIIYTLLTILSTAGYALLVAGLSLLLGNAPIVRNVYFTGFVIFLLALGLIPLRNFLVRSIDSIFLRNQATYQVHLQAFGRELTRATNLEDIASLLRRYVQENLNPIYLHTFTYNPLFDQYVALPDTTTGDTTPTSDLRFSSNSALVTALTTQRSSIYLGETRSIPDNLRSERARISLLNSQLFVPLPGGQSLTGWLALGSKASGEAYNSQDLAFLESICDQTALAIERARVVADLERRVHAMNVLTRVSQGINITLAFDDILELIYAQTNQIIPTRDFQITLYDRLNDFLYPVFFLEDDERDIKREKQAIPVGRGLERDVLRTRQPIACTDYERECGARDALPNLTGIFAWLGVPLNTGAETIGILSIASRDPTVAYTHEQITLLQAIADQAAGAIVKARLLEDSERRARHLSKLNEVARSLTSMLAIEPLLEQILNSAVEILNGESGSLLLVEEETGYLVLKAATGLESKNIIGMRLPKGSGLVGKAVDTRLPIIHNDISRNKDLSTSPNARRGARTINDMLVVPMQVNEQVLGVIEILNRKDGLPFTPEDQELLIAFTSQAAVALENARLYTLTDQSLADRVEELSVMQRIDRELNTSLDISRAMRITLEWAMRQSDADAGFVGIVEADHIRVMTAQGYASELEHYTDSKLPKDFPAILAALASGQPQWVYSKQADADTQTVFVLNKGKSQAVIPIRREREVIGILFLESLRPEIYTADIQAFLSRLSDHAAIAISNAQLFAEVQAANLAKSDFVSFVSHELKTPMTSIKGFSDLLAAGVVGSVNETQAHFLNTIRSNIDRMSTLVSDLADVSRIETGRLRLDFIPVDVAEIISEVTRSAKNLIDEKKQKLIIQVKEDLPPLWGDRSRLIQILTNLVNNAYKYTPPNGEIIISADVHVNPTGSEKVAKLIEISVRDTGIGISPENQKKIFQKFFRADDPKLRDIPGTGLGLNITKTLVEMQGGQIWFESIPDQGSTFHFTIPVVEGM